MANAYDRLRARSGSVYTPAGAAPDSGLGMNGFSVQAGATANAGAGVDASVQVAGVLVVLLLGVLVATHWVAR